MSYNHMHCCAEGLALQCLSLSDELINYIIIITIVCAIYTISCGQAPEKARQSFSVQCRANRLRLHQS